MKTKEIMSKSVYLLGGSEIATIKRALMMYLEDLKNFKEDNYANTEFKIAEKVFNKFSYTEIKYELQEEFLKKILEYYKKREERRKKK